MSSPTSNAYGHWLRRCAGECLWACVAAATAIVLLTLFVVAIEPAQDGQSLREVLRAPLNVTRLVVMTTCLAVWGYIVRAARGVPDGSHTAMRGPPRQS